MYEMENQQTLTEDDSTNEMSPQHLSSTQYHQKSLPQLINTASTTSSTINS